MKKLATMVVFFGVLAFFTLPAVADKSPTLVKIGDGKVEGVFDNHNTLAWKGIPFAKPPVGDLRWKKPDDPDKWGGVKQADQFCDLCPQYVANPEPPPNFIVIGSEDCLYLNVWRPDSEESDLPVYFWIHGGGNSLGSAAFTAYDGSKMASNGNLIVVSTNYRLGPLGWFTNPVLRKEKNWDKGKNSGQGKKKRKGPSMNNSGNYGTLDIIKALKWVQENIEAFGGDPNNVTIAGESAGAWNVHSLLLSPLAAGLFHRAIAQSGGPKTDTVADGDDSSDRVIDALMANDGIDRIGMKDNQIAHYLRKKTAEEILKTYTPGGFGMLDTFGNPLAVPPVPSEFRVCFLDGTVIPTIGAAALFFGQYNKVPIILGTNNEEHKMFISGLYDYYVNILNDPCGYQTMAENLTEMYWNPAVDDIAPLLKMHQDDVYAYRLLYGTYRYDLSNNCEPIIGAFNAWSDLRLYGGPNFALMLGAWHSLDIPLFFGIFEMYGLENYIFNPYNWPGFESLSDAMMTYVAQFAWTGDPGTVGEDQWNPWSNVPGEPKRILFDANATETLIEMSTE